MPPHPTIGNPIGRLNGGPGLGGRPIYHRGAPADGRGVAAADCAGLTENDIEKPSAVAVRMIA
jgi:hypothetical protein